jgi:gliding motility-associated-like protein
MLMRYFVLVLILLLTNCLMAQTCTTLGQNPSTAFPVCGTDTFSQSNVPACYTHKLNVPGCSAGTGAYEDRNPFWYRFTCYQSGTLGFLLTPNNRNADYDWMLYDITGKDPNEVFTNNSLIVTGNWAGTSGLTGASATGVNHIECGSNPADNKPTFAKMPNVIQGHTYLLLVSNFNAGETGYKLSFGGGTAVITDPSLPKMQNAWAGCGGVTVTLKLSKKMKCNSLAANASDFSISPAAATIVSVSGLGCSSSFDMDTVVLTMSNALPPASYTLTINNGTDGNTLLDNCENNIPAGDQVPFIVDPVQPTPMDSIKPVACAPNTLELVFRKPMSCASIAANGSDFIVTGPTPVTVIAASGNCVKGVSTTIKVQLANPIQTAGTYQIQLVRGSDGNTIIDECGQETPAGATLNFITKDTVNADFDYQLLYGCIKDTVVCSHDGRNGVNQWKWQFDTDGTSTLQDPTFVFPTFGYKKIRLAVSNGVCNDTTEVTVHLDNELKAAFTYPEVLCPEDEALFQDTSIGNIVSWNWDFGNGNTSMLENPPAQKYPPVTPTGFKMYTVSLIVQNNLNCYDTVTNQIKVVRSCYITVPNAFTPNNDGKNDRLYPLNAYKAVNLEFNIYNRYGQLIFRTTDWTRHWDGTVNGLLQATGVYVWSLRYSDRDTGQKIFKRGTTVLIR